jgi:hypothetical protein
MLAMTMVMVYMYICVIAREKQRHQLGGGAITDGTTDAKNASGDGPLHGCPVAVGIF